MSTSLVIVESPAKCKKIESYLGPGYKCIASFGHIRDLADGLKGIDIENNFQPTYRLLPEKGKYIAPLRKAIKKADEMDKSCHLMMEYFHMYYQLDAEQEAILEEK